MYESPKCLDIHVKTANEKLEEPYSELELKQIAKNMTDYMHDMAGGSESLNYAFCKTLDDWLNYIPEADEIMKHKRMRTYEPIIIKKNTI